MPSIDLELVTLAHSADLFRCVDVARYDLVRWFMWPDRVTSVEATRSYLEEVERGSRIKLWWLIYDADHQPVGGVQMRIRYGGAAVSLPYWIVPSARGQGVATTAVRRCLDSAKAIGFSEARFIIADHNTASQGVAQRLGFVKQEPGTISVFRDEQHHEHTYRLTL